MRFNTHSRLEGKHAFLSASKYHWLNYTPEKLDEVFRNSMAAQTGTELHALAATCIRLRVRLCESNGNLASYVNDAIDGTMLPEKVLYYSENCFGTPDAIAFEGETLTIHDLKTGIQVKGSKHQLEIYVALFCLEYDVDPTKIKTVLRIYQNGEIVEWIPEGELIHWIMNKIIHFDIRIQNMKEEAENG